MHLCNDIWFNDTAQIMAIFWNEKLLALLHGHIWDTYRHLLWMMAILVSIEEVNISEYWDLNI